MKIFFLIDIKVKFDCSTVQYERLLNQFLPLLPPGSMFSEQIFRLGVYVLIRVRCQKFCAVCQC